MTVCYLGLGSNLDCPERQLRRAVLSIQQLPQTVLLKTSSIYISAPLGVRAQPPYCNMVVSIHTNLQPDMLLGHCKAIERKQQRIRKKKWGARTIDIDILLYGQHVICQQRVNVPHPHMTSRDFVLLPLLEIAPNISLPDGRRLADFRKDCPYNLIFKTKKY